MAIADGLIVLGVFVGFGILILSRLRQKNPQGYDKMMAWLKDKDKFKGIVKKKDETPQQVNLPDNARIM